MEWSTDIIQKLGGVLVFPDSITRMDVQRLEDMKIPTLFAWESDLPGPFINFDQETLARVVTESLLLAGHDRIAWIDGFEKSLDVLKKKGILKALKSIGKSPESLEECSLTHGGRKAMEPFTKLVRHASRLTAVITADDNIAARFIQYLHSSTAIRVPETISVVSLHCCPHLSFFRPTISTVHFDFFSSGQHAAEVLGRASLSGDSVTNVISPGKIVAGNTIGPRSFSAMVPVRTEGKLSFGNCQ